MYHLRVQEGRCGAAGGREQHTKGARFVPKRSQRLSRRPTLVDVLQPALEALLLLVRGKGLLRQAAVVHHQAEGVVRVLLELGERQLEKGQQCPQLLAQPVRVLAVDCAAEQGIWGG